VILQELVLPVPDTFSKMNLLEFDKGGILAMANSGPTNSSLFITHKDTPWLNGAYHFGHVTQGMNVVNAIAKDDVIKRSLLREKALCKKV
jgi:cyclophilin family peptidyl-prolyl cis-trans isomerase